MVILGMENLYSLTGLQWLFVFGASIVMGVTLFFTGNPHARVRSFVLMTIGAFIVIITSIIFLS